MISLDPDVSSLVDAYRSCEFATLGPDGTPLAWPTLTLRQPDGSFVITTTLAFAQKAVNVRRDGRVALLFSDPTGSGRDLPPQVLVSGSALSPESVLVSPEGLEAYWAMVFARQPGNRAYLRGPMRRLMDWYFVRLRIDVEPTAVTTLPAFRPQKRASMSATGLVGAEALAQAPSAVLGARDRSGAPVLFRVEAVADAPAGGYRVDVPAGIEALDGPASLLMHHHDELVAGQANALVRGRLETDGTGRRLFVPERVVEPMRLRTPLDLLRLVRKNKQATRRYRDRRGISPAPVQWDRFRHLAG
ncbi:hypothetical protein Kisp01_41860 [Kineosporia sp. NBRC 101677]|uniref:pyridoxamine 5'-phosphate oxidase family protein n=1 Tax=Kineosporia sp. NBRC 101677 TaxID=3032197 RepID=UPI0024A5EBF1|nr:pyridoxamine 5'-phosphate oxidase family protein [Kineosporia sp. NBRC 101677]GLY17171.1 hypothetical protein Kisp01_41860 [Kineosporia sp. NBRC 101677]